ncbi:RING/Ubox like zinc-binding domain-containing protein [Ditylenchus destructor]|nr:RING/Ubox like zinc-binding domain-containing protein [Ditylenchus destructor]
MSSDEQSDKECPLCMEPFDDDINFFPCSCQYQICRFCWHRIRTDENGLCPACRQPYPEDPVNFQPLSSEDIQKIKTEKKQKQLQQKNKLSECRKHLSAYRVLQRNLVYVVGLSQRMADADLLKKTDFFGKYGKVIKVAVGSTPSNPNSAQPSYSAYVTYAKTDDALRAIQAVNNAVVDGRFLKASLGTTKYCSNFLKGQTCHKQECMYLHEVADEELSFTKDDMHQGKHTECERKLHEQMNALQQTVTNGHTDSKTNRSRQSSQCELEKAPPGFSSKVSTSVPSNKACAEGQKATKLDGKAWADKKSRQKTDANFRDPVTTQKSAEQSDISQSENVDQNHAETSNNGSSSPRNSHELEFIPDEPVKHTSSDSKLMMTCDELERILLSNTSQSVPPPGFQRQDSASNQTTSQSQDTWHTEAQSGNFNSFFLDLYDDIGFDPFMESSKALADLLEEEKTAGSMS